MVEAALVADIDSGIVLAGFAGFVLCFPSLSSGPGCAASCAVWTRRTVPLRDSGLGRLCSQLLAEPTVTLLFTVPVNGYTIVATAFVVTPYSSLAQPWLRGPLCCGSVCVAMSCVGGFSLLVVLTILFGTV